MSVSRLLLPERNSIRQDVIDFPVTEVAQRWSHNIWPFGERGRAFNTRRIFTERGKGNGVQLMMSLHRGTFWARKNRAWTMAYGDTERFQWCRGTPTTVASEYETSQAGRLSRASNIAALSCVQANTSTSGWGHRSWVGASASLGVIQGKVEVARGTALAACPSFPPLLSWYPSGCSRASSCSKCARQAFPPWLP